MADKNKMTKADHIRAEIERRVKNNLSTRPRDIIEALEKKGVEVTAPQVSVMVKKEVGATRQPVRAASAVKKPTPKAEPEKRVAARVASPSDNGQYDLLFGAAAFVDKCGSVESARAALLAYEKLTALRG